MKFCNAGSAVVDNDDVELVIGLRAEVIQTARKFLAAMERGDDDRRVRLGQTRILALSRIDACSGRRGLFDRERDAGLTPSYFGKVQTNWNSRPGSYLFRDTSVHLQEPRDQPGRPSGIGGLDIKAIDFDT